MENTLVKLPLIPLRGLSIFPHMALNFDIGREKSIAAVNEAMNNNQKIFVVAQREASMENPTRKDIYTIGCVCTIKQFVKLPGNHLRVLVEGDYKAKLINYSDEEEYIWGEVEQLEEIKIENEAEAKGYKNSLNDKFYEYLDVIGEDFKEIILELEEETDDNVYCDVISAFLPLGVSTKQELLECISIKERMEKLLIVLSKEIEVAKVEKLINNKVKARVNESQKEYYLREQLKVIQEELGEDDELSQEIAKYEKQLSKLKVSKEVKTKAEYEINRLKSAGLSSQEGAVIKTYIDILLGMPWNKVTKDNLDLGSARKVLEDEHYGLQDVKERIIEQLAARKISNGLKAPIICLVGPPGVGKTSIAKSIANALGRKFVRMSLGGVRDEAEIRGHRKTYVGAIPGRIVTALKDVGYKNPVCLLDEIDKVSKDYKGNVEDALLEVLDSEQNKTFRDHYLEVDFDLSKVLFITTANTLDNVSRPLLDRMEIIEVSGYTTEEKFEIGKKHLIPKLMKEYSIEEGKITIADNSLRMLIDRYTRESGVRSLERKLASLIRKAITEIMEGEKDKVAISTTLVKKYLGHEIYNYDDIDKEDKVGVVTGLAWTGYGGDTLAVEVSVMDGDGKLQLTGQLGDVMKESAKAGYSYVRAHCEKYNIDPKFYKEKDLHIHIPEGAIPKDGPSAGVTMVTAMISALSNRKVKYSVAMTGEVTLTGRVLPIGGLKEKSLAAYRMGIKTIVIPKDNEKDLKDIPKTVHNKIKYVTAEKIEDVLNCALLGE
ncbi:MAG: endopeptidase La [Clostridium sp.]|nr:endopeptidase La [Clostridium sp.]